MSPLIVLGTTLGTVNADQCFLALMSVNNKERKLLQNTQRCFTSGPLSVKHFSAPAFYFHSPKCPEGSYIPQNTTIEYVSNFIVYNLNLITQLLYLARISVKFCYGINDTDF